MKPKCHSIGVLYCKEFQNTEEEMFNNESGSDKFEEFLEMLGDKIELRGFAGYRGDLDVKGGTTGRYSVYTRWRDLELMYHVSTLLPYNKQDKQQIARKSRIGNDLGVIVFQDGPCSYKTPIASQFLHIYTMVTPIEINGTTHYRVCVSRQSGVPEFGPHLNQFMFFEKNEFFREFLLTKVVNGNLATLRAPEMRKIFCKPKAAFLEELVSKYM